MRKVMGVPFMLIARALGSGAETPNFV
jgi:hypothetical protein